MPRSVTIRYWERDVKLPVDPFDPEVQRVFTTGQCTSFARALHRETGWPLVVLCYGDDSYAVEDMDPLDYAASDGDHVVVRRPDGWYVDIYGAWPPGTRWEDLPRPVELADHEVAQLEWDFQNPRKALPFAKALLKALDDDPQLGLPA